MDAASLANVRSMVTPHIVWVSSRCVTIHPQMQMLVILLKLMILIFAVWSEDWNIWSQSHAPVTGSVIGLARGRMISKLLS
jgi:hypothetical protein